MTERRLALPLGFACGCVFALALYPLLRVVSAVVSPEPNPATIIWSVHSGYFWRLWTVAYASAMAALVGGFAARRDPERVARLLARAVPYAVAALVAQALLWP